MLREMMVKQYVAQVITRRGRAFRVFMTGDDRFYLFDPLDQPDGCSMCMQFPVRKSELRDDLRRALRHGVGYDGRPPRKGKKMGNHAAGKAVGLMAEVLLARRKPGESALDLLDCACEPYRNTDAEFEAVDPNRPTQVHPEYDSYTDPHPKAALGMLMVEAFAPNGLADLPGYAMVLGAPRDAPDQDAAMAAHERAVDRWWEEVKEPFRKRYGFW